jgi:poly(hydroxyalkanoate) depolymerase family esterase
MKRVGQFSRTLGEFARYTLRASRAATLRASRAATLRAVDATTLRHRPPRGPGHWIAGMTVRVGGARRYRLYQPPDVTFDERLPLLVMLHGCGQDAAKFAASTRMNAIAARERFLVLYPEQDRSANAHGCWNWFDTRSGRAYREAASILCAVDQVCLLYPVDRLRVAVAGLSAGASMAALVATRHPDRFRAVVMHSGISPGIAHSGMTALGAMQGWRTARSAIRSPLPGPAVRWPPLMVIHGVLDGVVSASNGQAAARLWAHAAGASAGLGRDVRRGKRYPMVVTDFEHPLGTAATLVEIEQLAHAWSGGAARQPYSDAQGPDASRMVWAFASRQFAA